LINDPIQLRMTALKSQFTGLGPVIDCCMGAIADFPYARADIAVNDRNTFTSTGFKTSMGKKLRREPPC
jgi:hypothetical protein